MEDPALVAKMLQANPAARAIMEANPRLHQLITSPNALIGMLQGAQLHASGGLPGPLQPLKSQF